MKLEFGRPSPALVVACIAVVIALGPAVRAANTIGSSDIIDESIQSEDIKNDEVKTDDIADGAVTGADIAANTLTAGNIATNAVGTAELDDLAVTIGRLAAKSVDSSKIVDGSVAGADIASNAVSSAKVLDNSLTTADLKGADVSRSFSVAAGAVAIGRCKDVNVPVAGAQAGEVAVLSLKGSAPSNVLIDAIRVPSANVVTVKVCNFTGAASPAISNLPVRIMTFG